MKIIARGNDSIIIRDIHHDDIRFIDFEGKFGKPCIKLMLSNERMIPGESNEEKKSKGHDIVEFLLTKGLNIAENYKMDENRNFVLDNNGERVFTGYTLKLNVYDNNPPKVMAMNPGSDMWEEVSYDRIGKVSTVNIEWADLRFHHWYYDKFRCEVACLDEYAVKLMATHGRIDDDFLGSELGY